MIGLRMASCFAIVVLSCALPSRVRAQQASGIAGAVTDPSGAVLPGVTVEAASPALIERTRSVVTDNAGGTRSSICDRGPTPLRSPSQGLARTGGKESS